MLVMWTGYSRLFSHVFWSQVGQLISQIIVAEILVNPQLMLLVDVDYFHLENYKILLANLLSATFLLIARGWKLQEAPVIEDWVSKLQETWLLSKLSAMCKYRAGTWEL